MNLLNFFSVFALLVLLLSCTDATNTPPPTTSEQLNNESTFGLVIHGGAGTIRRESMTPEMEQEYRAKLEEALQTGYAILEQGGSSLDAIVATINVMENSPLFNAGKGAVFTGEGRNELDASIMDGKTLNAGAIAGVTHVKNPINLARLVMEESPHVMLTGTGAETFGSLHNVEMVEPSYFYTERRWEQLQRAKASEKEGTTSVFLSEDEISRNKMGTVGAVALDKSGNLAAGTSTGGMTNKKFGRVGDAPIIGAGTYANNETCAVSATGHGEYFIRSVVAHDIAALMEYKDWSLQQATDFVVMERLVERGGEGGIIAIDAKGNMAMPFNSAGMYRGTVNATGKITVKIYKDE